MLWLNDAKIYSRQKGLLVSAKCVSINISFYLQKSLFYKVLMHRYLIILVFNIYKISLACIVKVQNLSFVFWGSSTTHPQLCFLNLNQMCYDCHVTELK